jgi:hypothetical protein
MPKRRSSKFLLCLAAAAALAWSVDATDVIIHLRNGDRLTGSIVSETPTEITIKTGSLGKITIPAAEVDHREIVEAQVATGTNTTAVATTTTTNSVAKIAAPSAGASTNTPTAGATVAAAPVPAPAVKPQEPKHWNSEIQLGLNLRYTTRDQQESLVVAKSTYARNRFREILDYNFTWGRTEEVQTANRMTGASKTEYDIDPKWYAFNVGAGGYDQIREINREYEIDPGIGYNLIKKPKLILKGEVGFGFHDQFFDDGHTLTTYSGRLAGIFTWRIYDKLIAEGRMEYFPNVKSIDEYRLRFESTLRYPLFKGVSLNLIVIDLYDTEVQPGVENNDLQVRTAVGMKF